MAKFVVRNQEFDCYIAFTLKLVGGKWKTLILWYILDGKKRFGELKRLIPGCTPRMLTRQLRELERDGILARVMFPEVPLRVEYSLTPEGETLRPILQLSCDWGKRRAKKMAGQKA